MNLIMKDHANTSAWIKFVADDYARRVNCRPQPKRRVLARTVTADNAFMTAWWLGMAATAIALTLLLAALVQLTPVA